MKHSYKKNTINNKLSQNIITVCFAIVTLLYNNSFAQLNPCNMKMGLNLAPVLDYSTSTPYSNLLKQSRNWNTTNTNKQPFTTAFENEIPLDANGYPTKIPFVASNNTNQIVLTVIQSKPGILPSGNYKLLYDGDGDIEFTGLGNGTGMSFVSPNNYNVNIGANYNNLTLYITRSNAANPIKNIRLLLPGTTDADEFNPVFIDKIRNFKTLRFMDWGKTNSATIINFTDRRKLSEVRYVGGELYERERKFCGVPYESMINLCNKLDADMWVCIPHTANDNFISSMATLIKTNLKPTLKCYVEFSNELWNPQFRQLNEVAAASGNIVGNESFYVRYGRFIKPKMNLFSTAFNAPARLSRVVAGQAVNVDIVNQIITGINDNTAFDAVSCSSYFGNSDAINAALASLTPANATNSQLNSLIRLHQTNNEKAGITAHKNKAIALSKKLLFYEGGQHLVAEGIAPNIENQLIAFQRSNEMYNLYKDWNKFLNNDIGSNCLYMHYSECSGNDKFGAWGALENINTTSSNFTSQAPKYKALIEDLCTPQAVLPCPTITSNFNNPMDSFLCMNATGNLSVATCDNCTFEWKKNGVAFATSASVSNLSVGKYEVLIKNICGSSRTLKYNFHNVFTRISIFKTGNIKAIKNLISSDNIELSSKFFNTSVGGLNEEGLTGVNVPNSTLNPISYQWFFNNLPIIGANQPTVRTNGSGKYKLKFTTRCGSQFSNEIQFTLDNK